MKIKSLVNSFLSLIKSFLLFVILTSLGLIIESCSDESGITPEEEPVNIHLDSDLVGYWRHIDHSFGFQIEESGKIWFMRTPISEGVFAHLYSSSDSIIAENGALTIFDSNLCVNSEEKTYSLVNDTLQFDSFFGSSKYVRTHKDAQFYLPSSNQFAADIKYQDSTYAFSNNIHNYGSFYSLGSEDFYISAEMNDIYCLGGPQSYRGQIRYIFIHLYPFTGTGMYALDGSNETYIQYGDMITGNVYRTTEIEKGTIEITAYDEISGVVEGVFSANVQLMNGSELLELVNGTFSYEGPYFELGPDY